jgi:hypothetical protein
MTRDDQHTLLLVAAGLLLFYLLSKPKAASSTNCGVSCYQCAQCGAGGTAVCMASCSAVATSEPANLCIPTHVTVCTSPPVVAGRPSVPKVCTPVVCTTPQAVNTAPVQSGTWGAVLAANPCTDYAKQNVSACTTTTPTPTTTLSARIL